MTIPPPPRPALVIATRGSKLALWQANYVASLLRARGVTTDQLVIKTTADKIQDRFLHEIGGKGLFVKELEQALAERRADLAIHSLKDMTATLQAPFALGAILKRHSPRDIIILRPDVAARAPLPPLMTAEALRALGPLTVGTGSLRRQAILKGSAPAVTAVPIRGNVDTRIRKLHDGAWDAIVLAEASVDRLQITDISYCALEPQWFLPSPSQGALAIETLQDDPLTSWLGATLGCAATTLHVGIERGLLGRLGGDCNMPFACHVAAAPDASGELVGQAAVYDLAGGAAMAAHRGPAGGARGEGFLEALTAALARAGAGQVLRTLGVPVPARFA